MPAHNCCSNYTRSALMRAAAAEAGKGLPVIENGMPVPAGTGLSRRSFISRSAGWRWRSTAPASCRWQHSTMGSLTPPPTGASWSRSSSTAASTR